MTRQRRKWSVTVALLLMVMVLTSCGSESATPESTSQPTQVVPTASPAPTLAMGDIVFTETLDESGQPANPVDSLPRSVTTIVAAVPVESVAAGTSFSAEWSIDGTIIPDVSDSVSVTNDIAKGWISFTLTWTGSTLWPVGELGISITANSGETVTSTVPITST